MRNAAEPSLTHGTGTDHEIARETDHVIVTGTGHAIVTRTDRVIGTERGHVTRRRTSTATERTRNVNLSGKKDPGKSWCLTFRGRGVTVKQVKI